MISGAREKAQKAAARERNDDMNARIKAVGERLAKQMEAKASVQATPRGRSAKTSAVQKTPTRGPPPPPRAAGGGGASSVQSVSSCQ